MKLRPGEDESILSEICCDEETSKLCGPWSGKNILKKYSSVHVHVKLRPGEDESILSEIFCDEETSKLIDYQLSQKLLKDNCIHTYLGF